MQHTQSFKRDAQTEELFKISHFCIKYCDTLNTSALTVSQAECLGTYEGS